MSEVFSASNDRKNLAKKLECPKRAPSPPRGKEHSASVQGTLGRPPGGADGFDARTRHDAGTNTDTGRRNMDGWGDGRGELKKKRWLTAKEWPI